MSTADAANAPVARRILLIDGHPDSRAERYLHALTKAYSDGARAAGHDARSIIVSELDFTLLRTAEEFQSSKLPDWVRECQERIAWADHLVILYPLWLGSMPALLKGFLEQVLRPGFAFPAARIGPRQRRLLTGKSARIVVTMGMPALFYRLYFRAHSLKSLERNVLSFCGIGPIRATVVGMVEGMSSEQRGNWLARLHAMGRAGR